MVRSQFPAESFAKRPVILPALIPLAVFGSIAIGAAGQEAALLMGSAAALLIAIIFAKLFKSKR